MGEKISTYLSLGLILALVVNSPEVVGNTIKAFAGGVASITGAIVR